MSRSAAVFDAMTEKERLDLIQFAFTLPGERLIGPEFEALRHHGLIDNPLVSVDVGRPVVITDLGQAVIACIIEQRIPDAP